MSNDNLARNIALILAEAETNNTTDVAHLVRDVALHLADILVERDELDNDGAAEYLRHLSVDLAGTVDAFEEDQQVQSLDVKPEVQSAFNDEFSAEEQEEVQGYLAQGDAVWRGPNVDRFLSLSERFANVLENSGATQSAEIVRSSIALHNLLVNSAELFNARPAGNA